MARIPPVPPTEAKLRERVIFWFVRRALARVTGKDAARVIEPLQLYAHLPGLVRGYAGLERATAALHTVVPRLTALAELKAATLTHCAYCIDIGSAVAHRLGITDRELLALPQYAASPLFSELDKLVLDYAVAMSSTPVAVPDELFERLQQQFTIAQIVELTHHIALENMRGRFNLALGVGSSGLSTGTVCAAPDTQSATGPSTGSIGSSEHS